MTEAMHSSEHPPSDPLVGQVLEERYRIERLLGSGGMGAVYLAEHLLMRKQVAIKCLHAGLASNADVVGRFKNEAIAASRIGHPNIVEVLDMFQLRDGTFVMVLEFLKGRDWQEDLDKAGTQAVEQVAHVTVQICEALEAAAAQGIVHRDLKPENIFLTDRAGDVNFVKVLDFGIAKVLDGTTSRTQTGALMGTPYYMAPEQVQGGHDISHLVDVYSLGVILFQVLSGHVPFEGDTLPQIIVAIATQPAPRLDALAPHLPTPLVELVMQMLDKDPSKRPQSFAEVAERLRPFLAPGSRLALAGMPRVVSSHPPLPGLEKTQLGAPAAPRQSTPQSLSQAASPTVQRPRWLVPALAAGLLGAFMWWSMSGDSESANQQQTTQKDDLAEESEQATQTAQPASGSATTGKQAPSGDSSNNGASSDSTSSRSTPSDSGSSSGSGSSGQSAARKAPEALRKVGQGVRNIFR